MTNFKKLCAFTLSELLLSLTIVGIIAVLTVPVIVSNVQKKMFATQVKNFSAQIEQLAKDELLVNRTRDLANTDFADSAKLMTSKHFNILKICTNANVNCWKTHAQGKDKITYKHLEGQATFNNPSSNTVILNNGMIVGYSVVKNQSQVKNGWLGLFMIDLNGNAKPNIAGRDVFYFAIHRKGYIVYTGQGNTPARLIELCKTNEYYCYGALIENNWKMDY